MNIWFVVLLLHEDYYDIKENTHMLSIYPSIFCFCTTSYLLPIIEVSDHNF